MSPSRCIDRILISTIPRSGTVYFSKFISALFGFKEVRPKCIDGPRPSPPEWDPYRRDESYRELGEHQVLCSHYFLDPPLLPFLSEEKILTMFLYRDLRDVAVSAALYIKYALDDKALHPFYTLVSQISEGDAIAFMLAGGTVRIRESTYEVAERDNLHIFYQGIGYFCEMAYPWLQHPKVAAIRFEDFTQDPVVCLHRELARVGVKVSKKRISAVSKELNFHTMSRGRNPGMEDKGSHFRSGVVGGFRTYFNEYHRALCKSVIGQDLITLGYESSLDW